MRRALQTNLRPSRRVVSGVVLLAGALYAATAGAQAPVAAAKSAILFVSAHETGALRVERSDTSGYPQVRLTVSAPHASEGSPPTFAVTENGETRDVKVRAIEGNALRVVLLFDTSGSMNAAAMRGARAAAHAFAARLPADAHLALMAFSTAPVVASPFDAPRAALTTAIDALVPSGETAMYDAVAAALDVFGPPAAPERRLIVLLSDGGDTVSTATLEAVQQQLQPAAVQLLAVELATAETDRAALLALTGSSDGTLWSIADPAALAGLYERIAAELAQSYELIYTSQAHDTAEVQVVLNGDAALASVARVDLPAAPPETPTPLLPRSPTPEAGHGTLMQPGLLARPYGLAGAAIALLLALVALLLAGPRDRQPSLLHTTLRRDAGAVAGIADWASRAAERRLQRHNWGGLLNRRLEYAGINLRPGEFVVLASCASLTAGITAHLLVGPLFGSLVVVLTLMLSSSFLNWRVKRRQAHFADQLGDTLTLLASSLRAGYSLLQAIDAVAREAEAPTRDEFRRLVVETRLGRPMQAALSALADRMHSEDFAWVADAIVIHREVGGDLAQVLDRVAATIRERNQIRRQAKALSAEGRLSAGILMALPFCVAAFVSVSNPGYLHELTSTSIGLAMLAVGALLLGAGGLWLRRIVKVVF